MLTVVGVLATVILVSALFAVVLLGRQDALFDPPFLPASCSCPSPTRKA
jgi:hypothetical protein